MVLRVIQAVACWHSAAGNAASGALVGVLGRRTGIREERGGGKHVSTLLDTAHVASLS